MQVHEIHRRTLRDTRQRDGYVRQRLRRRKKTTMIISGVTLGLMAAIVGAYHWMHSI